MPTRQLWMFIGLGVAAVAAILALTLVGTKGNSLELAGYILKVRTLATDDKHSLAVIDFRAVNHSTKQTFVVKDATVAITTAEGALPEVTPVARVDVNRVLEYYKMLGPKFNETLIMRDRIAPGQTMDRMLAVSVELPEEALEQRKSLTLTLHDLDGASFELKEKR